MPDTYSPPIIATKFDFENKTFHVELKENPRGKFLKITEQVGNRRDTILMPVGAVNEFIVALHGIVSKAGGAQ